MHFIHVQNPKQVEEYNKLLPGRHVMVMYYMDGCFFCDDLKPKWNKFEKYISSLKKYKNNDKYVIARVNSNYINSVNGDKNVIGYPTIMHLLDGKKKSEFTDKREKKALINYFKHIDDSQKGGTKKIKKRSSGKTRRINKTRYNKKRVIKRKTLKKRK